MTRFSRNKKAKINLANITLDVLGFALVLGGALIARAANNEIVSILGGIISTIGLGLLAVSRYLTK